jgi:hypothetical protein
MAVAMLLYVRASLIEGDDASALRRLLKYPPVEHVHTLVERALQLRRAFGADANHHPGSSGGGGGARAHRHATPQRASTVSEPAMVTRRGTGNHQSWRPLPADPGGSAGEEGSVCNGAVASQAVVDVTVAAGPADDRAQLAARMEAPLGLLARLAPELRLPDAHPEEVVPAPRGGEEVRAGCAALAAKPSSTHLMAVRQALAELRAVQRILAVPAYCRLVA